MIFISTQLEEVIRMNGASVILLIDDDVELCASIKQMLAQHGFDTIVSHTSQNIETIIAENHIDLILLDIILPGDKNGIAICKLIRQLTSAPIIMLTGVEADVEKIVSLEVGADNYITKPFNSRVLIAQIHACLRTRSNETSQSKKAGDEKLVKMDYQIYEFLGWRLNVTARILLSPHNKILKLTSSEFILLQAFLTHPQCVLSRDQLLDFINSNSAAFDRSIDILVSRLRSKLSADDKKLKIITTVRNAGYLLSCAVKRQMISSENWQQIMSTAETME